MARRSNSVPRSLGATLPAFVSHAHGAVIEDIDGNRFLDFAGGIGCLNAGHTPEAVVAAIKEQSGNFLHTCFMVSPYTGYVGTGRGVEPTYARRLRKEDAAGKLGC